MLVIGGSGSFRPITEEEIENPELVYEREPEYRTESDQLCKLPETRLGAPGVLYVNQREYAATIPEDETTKVTS